MASFMCKMDACECVLSTDHQVPRTLLGGHDGLNACKWRDTDLLITHSCNFELTFDSVGFNKVPSTLTYNCRGSLLEAEGEDGRCRCGSARLSLTC